MDIGCTATPDSGARFVRVCGIIGANFSTMKIPERKRLRTAPFPPEWKEIITRNLSIFARAEKTRRSSGWHDPTSTRRWLRILRSGRRSAESNASQA